MKCDYLPLDKERGQGTALLNFNTISLKLYFIFNKFQFHSTKAKLIPYDYNNNSDITDFTLYLALSHLGTSHVGPCPRGISRTPSPVFVICQNKNNIYIYIYYFNSFVDSLGLDLVDFNTKIIVIFLPFF